MLTPIVRRAPKATPAGLWRRKSLSVRCLPQEQMRQALAGHADLTTTMRYMHLAKGSKEAAIAVLDQPAKDRDLLETQSPG